MAGATNTVRIDIELLTKEAQAQVKLLNDQLNKIGKGMNSKAPEVIEQTGKNLSSSATAYANYAKAQETAGLKTSANVTRLTGLKTQMGQNEIAIKAQKQSLETLTKTYGEHDKRIDDAKNKLAEMRSQQTLMGAKVDELGKKYGNLTPKIAAAIDKQILLSQRMNRIGTSMNNIGRNLSMAFTAPIVGAFGLATHAASKYQYELQDVRKEVQAQGYSAKETNSIMKDLSNQTLGWAKKFGVSTTEINKGMFELVSNGYNVKQSMGMMPMLLKTMTANSDKTGKSIELTSSILEQFGMNLGSNSKVIKNGNSLMNQMTEATHKSAMKLDDLKVISGNAGAAMHAMGVSTNDFLALAGRLKSAGIDASSVGTGLSSMMTRIGTGTGQAAKDLKKYNIQVFDSAGKMKSVFGILGQMQKAYKGMNDEEKQKFMYDVVGQENMKVGMTLMDANLDRYKSLSDEIKNSDGTVDKYNKTMRKTNEFTQQQFIATLKALEIAFGEKLLPAITPVIKMFNDWVDNFSELNGNQQQFIIKTGLIVAALGPLLMIGGNIFKLIGNVHKGIADIQLLFGKSKILSKIELENAAYSEQLGLVKEINTQRGLGATESTIATEGAAASTAGNATRMARNTSGVGALKSQWSNAGIGSKLLAGGAAVDAASSFWGAIQAQSSNKRNQAIWEGGGKVLGLAVGGVLGGPAGAAAGEFIGGIITKNITIKNVKKFLDDDSKDNKPNKKTKTSKNMQKAPHDKYDNYAISQAESVRKQVEGTEGKISKKVKHVDPLKGVSKSTKKEIQGIQSELKKLTNSYNSTNTKIYKSLNGRVDNEISKEKDGNKRRLDLLVQSGIITQQQENQYLVQDNIRIDKKYSKQKKALEKLQALDEKYSKKGVTKDASYYKQREELLSQFSDAESKALSKNASQQEKITKQLSDKTTKMTMNRARTIKKQEDEIYHTTVDDANKARDKAVSAADTKYKKTVAAAKYEYEHNKNFSWSQYQEVKKAAEDQRDKSKKAAEDQCTQVVNQAKNQHDQVVTEIQQETIDVEGEMGSLSEWYARNNLFDTISNDAEHAYEKITGVKNGLATMADANAKIRKKKGKDAKANAEKKAGHPLEDLPKDYLSGYALGGAILKTHIALVGEEGPELAYSKNGKARVLGKYGPEVTTVFAGENILTASQTKKALKGKNVKSISSFAGGTGVDLDTRKLSGSANLDVSMSDKSLKRDSMAVTGQVDSMTRKSTRSLQNFKNFNRKNWKQIFKDTDQNAAKIKDSGVKNITDLSKSLSALNTKTSKFWHKDWLNMANDFNTQMSLIIGYARQDMSGAIGQLNHGISNINVLVGKFGGNTAILPAIPAYESGTDGRLSRDELALVNDGHGPNYRELIQHNDGSFTLHKDKNKVVPLRKGERVFNGQQTNYLLNQGLVTPHADGTVPDDELTKMVEDKIKNPGKAWNNDYSSQVSDSITPGLARSMAISAKNAMATQGVPWYQAVWDVIKDEMGLGSGSRGAFLKYAVQNYMGKPYLMGGNGPTYYDCSGMVAAALKHFGIDIGRTTTKMQTTTSSIGYGDSKPGDLSIWGNADGALGHVGIVANHNGVGKMFNETPPHAKYDPIRGNVGIPWKGTFRINQLHDEDPNMPKVSPKLKALVKSELGSKALSWISNKYQSAGTNNTGVSPTPTGGHNDWMAAAGISARNMAGYAQIIAAESGWNPHATNPSSGAYGLPQALPGSKMASAGSDWRTNPITQLKWMKSYVNSRYGSIAGALAYRRRVGWYADGGWGQNGKLNVFNETPGENEIVVNPHRKSAIRWLKEALSATAKLQPSEFNKAFAPVELPEEMKNVDQNVSIPTGMAIATPESISNYRPAGTNKNGASTDGIMSEFLQKISGKGLQLTVNLDSQSIITENIPLINALLGNDSVNVDIRGGAR